MSGVALVLLAAVFAAEVRRRRAERRAERAEAALREQELYHVGRVADLELRLIGLGAMASGRASSARTKAA